VVYAESNRRYRPRDLQLLQELGERAGIAIENARLYREAQPARAQLERANQVKDEFLGIVAHELRSPLSTILGGARLLNRRPAELADADQHALMESIEGEAQRMADLVENLLLLARAEIKERPETEEVRLPDLIELIMAFLRNSSPDRILVVKNGVQTVAATPLYLE